MLVTKVMGERKLGIPSCTVAIIDDDESVRRGLTRLLSAYGCTILTYTSSEAFLRTRENCRADVVIADIHLPGLSGVDLARYLEASGGPAVILMTGQGDNESAEALVKMGRTSCLSKPFTSAQLLDAMLFAGLSSGDAEDRKGFVPSVSGVGHMQRVGTVSNTDATEDSRGSRSGH